nr:hypothetical protein [Burkholderia pyrrocinia]
MDPVLVIAPQHVYERQLSLRFDVDVACVEYVAKRPEVPIQLTRHARTLRALPGEQEREPVPDAPGRHVPHGNCPLRCRKCVEQRIARVRDDRDTVPMAVALDAQRARDGIRCKRCVGMQMRRARSNRLLQHRRRVCRQRPDVEARVPGESGARV